MKNPFKTIQFIDGEELINRAFRTASEKVQKEKPFGKKTEVGKKREQIRVETVGNIISNSLRSLVRSYPDLNSLNDVYKELLEIYVPLEKLKETLAKINWASKKIFELKRRYLKSLKGVRSSVEARKFRKEFYGRVSSIMKKIRKDLILLSSLYELKKLPDFEEVPTAILCGLPNVGKSSLLWKLTGSKPEIKNYPFTTKGIMIGFIEDKGKKYQIIDTPGLLERPIEKRNKIEKKAIVVLEKLSDIVIFVFDISSPLKPQIKLLENIQKNIKRKYIFVANKIDLQPVFDTKELQRYKPIFTSCETEEGIEDLKNKIIEELRKK